MHIKYLKLIPGYRTALFDGVMVPDSPKHMATENIYHAYPGSRVHLCKEGYLFAIAEFSLERNGDYIYSYAYQKEENWATYTQNLTPESYDQEDYVFEKECYFRACLRRIDGADLTAEENLLANQLLQFENQIPAYVEKPYFTKEINDTVRSIQQQENQDVMKICLLTDTHYTVNGTWEDTAYNIRKVAEKVQYDAIVHMGDLTDGMLSKEMTRQYAEKIIEDLKKCESPVYITPGNHDSNYFRNNGNTFTYEEMRKVYGLYGKAASSMNSAEGQEEDQAENKEGIDYYVDVPERNLRMIFLASFENGAPVRYGYREHQLKWLEKVLKAAEAGTRFLIFSHDGPLAKLDYWSYYIENGEELLQLLEEYNAKEEYQVIGFFYGHTHADYVFEECSFPVISIGCAKLEYFEDKKPAGVTTWPRKADDVTQELWDSLLIDFENQKLKLVRFGAGEDREVSFVKKKSTYKERALEQRSMRKTKIWAHRGVSAHAPENTMPAFMLAHKMGADGIELDVQLTKDGMPVIIHDEKIDRVCDGTGWVKDYTLEELKAFHAGKLFPAYGKVEIPTLEEFYQWVSDTDLSINLELKNSVIFYEGLEEKVLRLAERYGLEERIIYSSFNHYSMRKMKQLNPTVKVAFLYSNGILDVAEYADKYNGYAVHPSLKNMEYPEVDLVKECHAMGIRVHVWTVNQKQDLERMKALGVDAVITNYVELGMD